MIGQEDVIRTFLKIDRLCTTFDKIFYVYRLLARLTMKIKRRAETLCTIQAGLLYDESNICMTVPSPNHLFFSLLVLLSELGILRCRFWIYLLRET